MAVYEHRMQGYSSIPRSWIRRKWAELQVEHHRTASQDLALVLSMRELG